MEDKYVVCIRTGEYGYWSRMDNDEKATGPNKGDILEIVDFDADGWYMFLEFGWRAYDPVNFRPINSTFGEETCERMESLIPETQTGAVQFMEIMGMKSARDLALDVSTKK